MAKSGKTIGSSSGYYNYDNPTESAVSYGEPVHGWVNTETNVENSFFIHDPSNRAWKIPANSTTVLKIGTSLSTPLDELSYIKVPNSSNLDSYHEYMANDCSKIPGTVIEFFNTK